MAFKDLIKHSKVLTLPKSRKSISVAPSAPQHQVLETTAASFHRRNWGLKSPVPRSAGTRMVGVGRIENERAMPEIELNPRFARKVERIEETGIAFQTMPAVLYPRNYDTASSGATSEPRKRLSKLSKVQLQLLTRKAASKRSEYLKTTPDLTSQLKPASVERFMGLESSALLQTGYDAAADFSSNAHTGGMGLTYAMPGVLHNTTSGMRESLPVQGRVMAKGRPSSSQPIAVAGFVASSQTSESLPENQTVLHERPRNLALMSISASPKGEIQISARPLTSPTDKPESTDFSSFW